jgi:hypothetical protein
MSIFPSKRAALMAYTRFTVDSSTPSLWRVTFNHPPINLIDSVMIGELGELFAEVERNEGPAVLVFDSADPDYFLAHYDITADNRSLVDSLPAGPTGFHPWVDIVVRLGRLPAVTIAAIRGRARAAGSEFALASDIRFASGSGPCSVRWKSASVLFLEAAQRLGCLVWSDGAGRSRSCSEASTSMASSPSATAMSTAPFQTTSSKASSTVSLAESRRSTVRPTVEGRTRVRSGHGPPHPGSCQSTALSGLGRHPDRVDKSRERRRHLASTRVIEEESGKRRTPIFKHPRQRASLDERGNLVLDQEREAHTGEGGIDDHIPVIEDERTFYPHLYAVAAPLEFPFVDRSCRRQPEVDAAVLAQVVRR